jgi:hypothetical protein
MIFSTLSIGCAGAGASALTESVPVIAALQAKAQASEALSLTSCAQRSP